MIIDAFVDIQRGHYTTTEDSCWSKDNTMANPCSLVVPQATCHPDVDQDLVTEISSA
jgi:hypothetical protein